MHRMHRYLGKATTIALPENEKAIAPFSPHTKEFSEKEQNCALPQLPDLEGTRDAMVLQYSACSAGLGCCI